MSARLGAFNCPTINRSCAGREGERQKGQKRQPKRTCRQGQTEFQDSCPPNQPVFFPLPSLTHSLSTCCAVLCVCRACVPSISTYCNFLRRKITPLPNYRSDGLRLRLAFFSTFFYYFFIIFILFYLILFLRRTTSYHQTAIAKPLLLLRLLLVLLLVRCYPYSAFPQPCRLNLHIIYSSAGVSAPSGCLLRLSSTSNSFNETA